MEDSPHVFAVICELDLISRTLPIIHRDGKGPWSGDPRPHPCVTRLAPLNRGRRGARVKRWETLRGGIHTGRSFPFPFNDLFTLPSGHDGQHRTAAARVLPLAGRPRRHCRRHLDGRMEEAVPGRDAPHLRGLVDELQWQRENDL